MALKDGNLQTHKYSEVKSQIDLTSRYLFQHLFRKKARPEFYK